MEITRFVRSIYPDFPLDRESYANFFERMRQDKKNEGSEINFTFIGPVGTCHVNQTADAAAIGAALDYYRGLK